VGRQFGTAVPEDSVPTGVWGRNIEKRTFDGTRLQPA
jgi:hypothetical protein